jgi:hypothetical protein
VEVEVEDALLLGLVEIGQRVDFADVRTIRLKMMNVHLRSADLAKRIPRSGMSQVDDWVANVKSFRNMMDVRLERLMTKRIPRNLVNEFELRGLGHLMVLRRIRNM